MVKKFKFRGLWCKGAFPLLRTSDDRKSNTFIVAESVIYTTKRFGYQKAIYVKPGFETDLASIPRFLPMCLHRNRLNGPAIIHDFIYRGGTFILNEKTRKRCDQVFLDAMLDNGVTKVLAYTYYLSVRIFGRRAYHADA